MMIIANETRSRLSWMNPHQDRPGPVEIAAIRRGVPGNRWLIGNYPGPAHQIDEDIFE
jgi:hypothetical protein